MIKIKFNVPHQTKQEFDKMKEVMVKGKFCGDGEFTLRASNKLNELVSTKKILLTPSCTHSLEMAALLLGIVPGDEIIMPSFTFVSTANAFILYGAKIIWVDINPDTLNIDEKKLLVQLVQGQKLLL